MTQGQTRPQVVTFGCRLNQFESEVIADLARDATDTVVVNTCAVTAEAERQARQAIRRLKRERPDVSIVVTGCAAQIDPDRFIAMPEVSRVVGNVEKLKRETWMDDGATIAVADIMTVRETAAHLIAGYADHTRAFVEIQQGCDHRCTFCIIPFGRGPNRSVPPDRVVDHVRNLAENGYREVVLTGVDIASYGRDLPEKPSLGRLVRQILATVPNLERLRLSSLDPAAIDDDIFDLLGSESRLMPHLHLSLQSGDDLILKRMKRRHSRDQAVAIAARARAARPDIALGADLIAGFPTETDAMAERSLALIEELRLAHVHVFPFSARPGTPAQRMPQLPGPLVRARAQRLREAAEQATSRFHRNHIGTVVRVLVERSGRAGYSEHFARIHLDGTAKPGKIVSACVTDASPDGLRGQLNA